MIAVRSWGIASTVVDAGRPGRAWLGQSRGGAVDVDAHALGNRLVGNPPALAAFETSGGMVLAVDAATMVCLTGALAEVSVVAGPPLGWGTPTVLPAGSTLRVGRLLDGARAYVAVRGGCEPLAPDEVAVGADPGTPAAGQGAPRRPLDHVLRVWPGPRLDWFVRGTWERLLATEFTVAATSRVGVRLSGPPLVRSRHEELPSEGLIEGAIQVPPSGQPIIMLADHPVTGGYPVLASADPADLTVAAQAAVGTVLRLRPAGRR